jgi:ankyrin repeat protein
MNACAAGHKACILTLFDLGCDVTETNYVGRTCLHWASAKGHDETVPA